MAFISDGYQTLIFFNALPVNFNAGESSAVFRERSIKPPDMDSNGVLDTTTMRNIQFRSFQPKRLLGTPAPMTCEVQYDPAFFGFAATILLNLVDYTVIQFPDGSQIKFYGWIGKFSAKPLKEGEFASADIDVHNSFQDANGVNQVLEYFPPNAQFMTMPGTQAPYE